MWASYPTSWDVTQQYLCTFCSQFSASVCSNTAIRTPSHMLSGKVMYATRLGEGTQLLPMWIQSPGSTRPSLCHQLPRMLHLQPLPRKRMPPNLAPKNLPIFLLAKILYQHFGWSFIYCILIYRYINTCTRIYNSFSSYFYSISRKKKKKKNYYFGLQKITFSDLSQNPVPTPPHYHSCNTHADSALSHPSDRGHYTQHWWSLGPDRRPYSVCSDVQYMGSLLDVEQLQHRTVASRSGQEDKGLHGGRDQFPAHPWSSWCLWRTAAR